MSTTTESRLNAAGNFALGVSADAFAVVATQPIDTLKTYVMSGKGLPPFGRLWHGTLANCSGAFVQGGLPFLVNGMAAKYLFGTTELSHRQLIANGMLTGLIASVAIAPFERVAKLHQLYGGSALSALKRAVGDLGTAGLFKAIAPIAVRDMIVFGTFFGFRKVVEDSLEKAIPNDTLRESIASIATGVFSGALSAPADRINVLMQGDTEGKYQTMAHTLREVVQKEGFKSLYKGAAARCFFVGSYYLALGFFVERTKAHLPGVFYEASAPRLSE